jgi:hypothetical protein
MNIIRNGLKALVVVALASVAFGASAAPVRHHGYHGHHRAHHRVVHHRHPVRHHAVRHLVRAR